jgi:hypothetical protein
MWQETETPAAPDAFHREGTGAVFFRRRRAAFSSQLSQEIDWLRQRFLAG